MLYQKLNAIMVCIPYTLSSHMHPVMPTLTNTNLYFNINQNKTPKVTLTFGVHLNSSIMNPF